MGNILQTGFIKKLIISGSFHTSHNSKNIAVDLSYIVLKAKINEDINLKSNYCLPCAICGPFFNRSNNLNEHKRR